MDGRIKLASGLYNLIWSAAIPLLRFNPRLSQGFKERQLKENLPQPTDIWIQAASVGESFLAAELLRHLRFADPVKILLTSNTLQGLEAMSGTIERIQLTGNNINAHCAYFPFDKPAIMQQAVTLAHPRVMVLLETELWPGLLLALKTYGCRILVVNGRLAEKSLRKYLIWPGLWQYLRPDRILAVSEADGQRFAELFGEKYVGVMPNMKFDRIEPAEFAGRSENAIRDILPAASEFMVLGSVRRQEEIPIENMLRDLHAACPRTVIGLFPRHLSRLSFWQKRLDRLRIDYTLRSKIENRVPAGTVILWDTFGELSPAYGLSKAAFVGGSLAPLGGQNFLEALACGVRPVIGPSWENFAWVGPQIVDQKLVQVARDWQEARDLLIEGLKNPEPHQQIKEKAMEYFAKHRGGTLQACRLIESFFQRPERSGMSMPLV